MRNFAKSGHTAWNQSNQFFKIIVRIGKYQLGTFKNIRIFKVKLKKGYDVSM